MDEVLFHVSERLEVLQVHLVSYFQHGIDLLYGYTEQFSGWTNSSLAVQINYNLNQILQQSQRILHELKELARNIPHPQYVFSHIFPGFRFDSTNSNTYYGSIGFLLGASFGLFLGLSWKRTAPISQRMRAIVCTSYSGPDSLAIIDDAPCPVIRNADELMIQVKTASVDPIDVRICWGYGRVLRRHLGRSNSNSSSEFPVILGRDCAGIVVELGQKVLQFEIGDEVWFSVPYWASGVLAEYVVVKQNIVARKPKGVTFEVAASLPYSGMLAWDAMVEQAGLNAKTSHGRRVLVHTACSPVGCLLIQLAHLWGAHVTVTCPLRATPIAQALGADNIVVCNDGSDVEKKLLQLEPFDAVFNTVGSVAHDLCLKFCRVDGKVVTTVATPLSSDTYGFVVGLLYSFVVWMQCMFKRLVGFPVWKSAVLNPAILEQLGGMVETGGLQPVVDKIFNLQDAELAFQHVEVGDSIGKTIVRFRSNLYCTCGAYTS